MNHKVPKEYPGVYPPEINSFCDVVTNINVALTHFIEQLDQHHDHTVLNLVFPATVFVNFPRHEETQKFIDAINAVDCKVTLNIYVVEWWNFNNSRRNLQEIT